jgi:hypothetical protein
MAFSGFIKSQRQATRGRGTKTTGGNEQKKNRGDTHREPEDRKNEQRNQQNKNRRRGGTRKRRQKNRGKHTDRGLFTQKRTTQGRHTGGS